MMSPEITVLLMVVALFALLALGMPMAFATGSTAVIFLLLLWSPKALSILIGSALHSASHFTLLAIPLFIFMGTLLEKTGVAADLYRGLYAWTSGLRGGLAMATVVIGAILAAMTGIAGAEVVTIGLIALPSMLRHGYDKRIVLGTILASGTLGELIPPSLLLIVYGSQTGVSVSQLFAGGIPAGIIFAILFMVYIGIRCILQKKLCPIIPLEDRPLFKEKLAAIPNMLPIIFLVFAVLGSIFFGIATPTEAASVGALGAFLIALAHRRITWDIVKESSKRTFGTAGMCMWIVVGGTAFASVFTALGGPETVEGLLTGASLGNWAILAIMLATLLVMGCFLDPICIIILTVPVYMPLVKATGFDPLWFGLVYVATLQTSYITPPFGYSIFFLKGISPPEVTIDDIYISVWPFVILQLLGVSLLVLFPQAILWLPRLMRPFG